MSAPLPVIWWNQKVLAPNGPNRPVLVQEAGSVADFLDFTLALADRPKAIRLFYFSPSLEYSATSCPIGTRATIQRALSARFPSLENPEATWAIHPIRAPASGATTLLYIEQGGRLQELSAALAERGIQLEAVIPLLVLVEATPPADRRPGITLLYTDEAACVYWITEAGDRHALFIDGPTARERAVNELANGFSAFGEAVSPVFVVVSLGENKTLGLPTLRQKIERTLSAADLFACADKPPFREAVNFLPPKPKFTWDQLCHVAAFALFLCGLGFAATYTLAMRTAQANAATQRGLRQTLEENNARLRANRRRIEAANVAASGISTAPAVKLRFLEALDRARPAQISILSVTLNEATWSLSAYAHEGVGTEKGPYQVFLANLQRDPGWTLNQDGLWPLLRQPDFTLNGTLR